MAEKSEERIHVCYCGNEKVFPLILLSAISIAKYTAAPVSLYLVTANLTRINEKFVAVDPSRAEILTEALRRGNPDSEAKIIDATDVYEKVLGGGKTRIPSILPIRFCDLYCLRWVFAIK